LNEGLLVSEPAQRCPPSIIFGQLFFTFQGLAKCGVRVVKFSSFKTQKRFFWRNTEKMLRSADLKLDAWSPFEY
jgi:hypothetical protein